MKLIAKILLVIFLSYMGNLDAQWTEQESGVIEKLTDVSFVDSQHGIIIGSNETILITIDGGSNWTKVGSPVKDAGFKKVQLIDKDNGFIVGNSGLILKTVDGGYNWSNISSLFMKYHFSDLSFIDSQEGWISCWWQSESTPIERIGAILHTSDGGNEWETQLEIKSGLQNSTVFKAVEFLNENLGWALGGEYDDWTDDDTYLFKTTDGGKNWEIISLVATYQVYELNVVDETTIWCYQWGINVSNDGGYNWSTYDLDFGTIIQASLVDGKYGWGYSRNIIDNPYNKIFFTNILGRPWIEDTNVRANIQISKMINVDGEYLWAVGEKGLIMHRRGMPSSIDDDELMIEELELMQNYPNPFNPSTKISYRIPDKDYVVLKIYNILGKEVAVLVNGIREAGSHEIDFNADHLSSGLYFYKITAGNYSETKKMILLN
jgi:photosystem II stability/assembly factor-like uncharacterized protein